MGHSLLQVPAPPSYAMGQPRGRATQLGHSMKRFNDNNEVLKPRAPTPTPTPTGPLCGRPIDQGENIQNGLLGI